MVQARSYDRVLFMRFNNKTPFLSVGENLIHTIDSFINLHPAGHHFFVYLVFTS